MCPSHRFFANSVILTGSGAAKFCTTISLSILRKKKIARAYLASNIKVILTLANGGGGGGVDATPHEFF